MRSLGIAVLRKSQGTCDNPRHTGEQEGRGGDPGRHTCGAGRGAVLFSSQPVIGRYAGPPSSQVLGGSRGVRDGACRLHPKAWLLPQGCTGSCPGRGLGAREGSADICLGLLPRANGKKKQHGQRPREHPEVLPCCLFCPQPGVP